MSPPPRSRSVWLITDEATALLDNRQAADPVGLEQALGVLEACIGRSDDGSIVMKSATRYSVYIALPPRFRRAGCVDNLSADGRIGSARVLLGRIRTACLRATE